MDKEEEYKKIMEILDNSIVVDDSEGDDNLGKDLQEIAKEITNDRNAFRFSNVPKSLAFYDAELHAWGDVPKYEKDVKPRYSWIRSYQYHLHINLGAEKSGQADRYKDLASSLMAFGGSLQFREAGVQNDEGQKKSSIIDRIKKG